MKQRLLQVFAIGIMVLFMGAAWAESEDGEHHRMHRSHDGMMHGGPDIDRMVEHLSRQLELDERQELAIRKIVDGAKPEAEALRQQARSDRQAMHELDVADAEYDAKLQDYASRNGELATQMTLLHGRVMAKINAELTDEQRAKLSKERDGMHERFRHHRRSHDSAENTTT